MAGRSGPIVQRTARLCNGRPYRVTTGKACAFARGVGTRQALAPQSLQGRDQHGGDRKSAALLCCNMRFPKTVATAQCNLLHRSATCCEAARVCQGGWLGGVPPSVAKLLALRWSRSAGFVAKKATPFEEEELVKQVTASKPGRIHVQRS
jgi:hypothetical protein